MSGRVAARNVPTRPITTSAATANDAASIANGDQIALENSKPPTAGPSSSLAADSLAYIRPLARSSPSYATTLGSNACAAGSNTVSPTPNPKPTT